MPAMAARRSPLVCATVLAALLAPAVARADSLVTELVRDTPISAYGGALAWSAYDEASGRYSLVIRRGATTAAAAVATAGRAFDVSLGPDVRGRVVALYTRCRTATRGCDVYRYDLRTRRESRVRSVSSQAFDESWPAQWRDCRRLAAHPHARREPPGSSSRSERARAARVVFDAVRQDAVLAGARPPPEPAMSRRGRHRDSRRHDRPRVRDGRRPVACERRPLAPARPRGRRRGGYSPFISPNLSASAVWLTRTGEREGEPQGFLRIDLPSGRITAVRPNLPVAGRLARDERGTFWYVQGPEPGFDYHQQPPFCVSSLDPCRLVRASASPFSTNTRTLLPRLRLLAPSFLYPTVFADRPFVLSGDVTRAVVRGRDLVSRLPAPASTRPDAAGRWSLVLRQPPPAGSFAVDAVTSRLRSPVLVVESLSRIAFAASGRALTGSVTPAQPGGSSTSSDWPPTRRAGCRTDGRCADSRTGSVTPRRG